MNVQHTLFSLLMLGLIVTPAAHAEPPVAVQIEVNFLLGYLDGSACEFNRNGTWNDAQTAQAHLRMKYNYLSARNKINTTEEFIEYAASKSSFTGQPYEVKCAGAATVTSSDWLRSELARFRGF